MSVTRYVSLIHFIHWYCYYQYQWYSYTSRFIPIHTSFSPLHHLFHYNHFTPPHPSLSPLHLISLQHRVRVCCRVPTRRHTAAHYIYYTALHHTNLPYITPHHSILYNSILHHTTLHYATPHNTTSYSGDITPHPTSSHLTVITPHHRHHTSSHFTVY